MTDDARVVEIREAANECIRIWQLGDYSHSAAAKAAIQRLAVALGDVESNGLMQRLQDAAGLELVTLLMDAAHALNRAAPGSVLVGALERAATKVREANKTDEWHAQRADVPPVVARQNAAAQEVLRRMRRAIKLFHNAEDNWGIEMIADFEDGTPEGMTIMDWIVAAADEPPKMDMPDAKDAARYRWLRDRTRAGDAGGGECVMEFPDLIGGREWWKGSVAQHLDNAIDAKLEGQPKVGGQ